MKLEVAHLTWGIFICLLVGLVEPLAFAGTIILACVLIAVLLANGRELNAKALAEAIARADQNDVR